MNILTLLVLILFSALTAGDNPSTDMNTIRQEYIEAVNSDNKTDELLKKLSKTAGTEPLLIAYKGATEALKAKHAFNPYTKLSYLKKSNESLQQAIQLRPQDVEIRFLRFSIQHYLPAFLRSDKELQEDKSVIIEHLKDEGLEKPLRQSIGKFMLESGRCTAQEVKQVKIALES
ncbi:hypothetical protein GXP67_07570 [Rhodocytophaga rosea]|uniref:Uncharacterized protein n=1 Tax=Rhodocytophaga rosea TaxID=2704465 RepID=A0A6C0GEW4_9BACT|nr:hypothetical protein [Rhodocytophaga rosea]QHT66525.1 hypothetical protein GXP67_07570 [Rhodocytophaga rosea]